MKKKTRVLIDTFHLANALTGIRTYTTQLCEGIEKEELEDVEYLIYPNWRRLNQTTFLRGNLNVFKKILNHLLYFGWKQFCLPWLILFKRVDVVVAPDYLLPYFKFGAKTLAVFHDTFYWELKGNYNPLWRWYFLKSVMMGLNKRSGIVVTTKYIADKVKSIVTNEYPTSVVYQAPKSLCEMHGDDSTLNVPGLPHDSDYFLHVGVFDKRKNLQLLVKAFDRLLKSGVYEDLYLVLVGSRAVTWFHDDFENVKKLIRKLNLENRVILPGFISDKDLYKMYKSAFAYVFPSREEGFGIPVIEAMKIGVPVIISDQPALVEVANGAALIFDMGSEKALEKAMAKLTDNKLRLALIKKGTIRSLKFSQKSFFDQFHSVVKESISHQ